MYKGKIISEWNFTLVKDKKLESDISKTEMFVYIHQILFIRPHEGIKDIYVISRVSDILDNSINKLRDKADIILVTRNQIQEHWNKGYIKTVKDV